MVIAPKAGDHCKLDGNQALALGALLGGCQFMAGYPMTPATSIMHYFATVAAEIPVHFEQAEDEIAALNMALGASYAGLRSMVATSGGGFALMTEAVSLAGMTETPIVIIDSQRPGPATGLPTRTEQGDLNFVLHAGHGEFPRVIFAPGSIEGAIALARKSFRCGRPLAGSRLHPDGSVPRRLRPGHGRAVSPQKCSAGTTPSSRPDTGAMRSRPTGYRP